MEKILEKNVYRGMNVDTFLLFKVLERKFPRPLCFLAVFALCFALEACSFVDVEEEKDARKMTFLDVGQGLAVLLEDGGNYALFDTGPDSIGFVDTLLARGVHRLEWVLISHSHRDHAGGFLEFASAMESKDLSVKHLFVGPDANRGFVRDSVLRLARRFDVPVDTLVRGDVVDDFLGDVRGSLGFGFEVLWPPKGTQFEENAASVVMLVSDDAGSALLTADLDSLGEQKLIEMHPSLEVDLLQVPHHGSAYSSTLGFLSRLNPGVSVISVGKHNSYGHPAPSVMQKLLYVMGDSSMIFRTDLEGSVSFEWIEGAGLISKGR